MITALLAGGGTTGHIAPLLATAERLQEANVQVIALGTDRGLETTLVPQAGFELRTVDAPAIPRQPSLDFFRVPGRLFGAVRQVRKIIAARQVDLVIGFGGFASAPAYLAASTSGTPHLVQEQNSVPGLANQLGASGASAVLTTFANTKLPQAEFIGLPMRQEITTLDKMASRSAARNAFKIDQAMPTLLVTGGSQGAQQINTAILAARDYLLAQGIQIIHIVGKGKITDEHASRTDASTRASYQALEYLDRMAVGYAAADLLVGRAGAGTVNEAAVVGLPSVLVPLPHGNGEQARNAQGLVQAGGAELVENSAFTGALAENLLTELLHDSGRLRTMGRAGRDSVPADADQVLADKALTIAEQR